MGTNRTLVAARQQVMNRVGLELGREIADEFASFHERAARKLSLNATDVRCLELIVRAPEGKITAGDLGRVAGLSTGGTTIALDRLQAAGLVQRFRDSGDRRKMVVEPTPEAAVRLNQLYASLSDSMVKMLSRYKAGELELIRDFLERNLEVLRAQNEALSKGGAV